MSDKIFRGIGLGQNQARISFYDAGGQYCEIPSGTGLDAKILLLEKVFKSLDLKKIDWDDFSRQIKATTSNYIEGTVSNIFNINFSDSSKEEGDKIESMRCDFDQQIILLFKFKFSDQKKLIEDFHKKFINASASLDDGTFQELFSNSKRNYFNSILEQVFMASSENIKPILEEQIEHLTSVTSKILKQTKDRQMQALQKISLYNTGDIDQYPESNQQSGIHVSNEKSFGDPGSSSQLNMKNCNPFLYKFLHEEESEPDSSSKEREKSQLPEELREGLNNYHLFGSDDD